MRASALVLTLLLSLVTVAQARQGLEPASRRLAVVPVEALPELFLPPVEVEALLAEDADRAERGQGGPLRFAERIEVHVTPDSHGSWEELADGARIWRLRVRSPGATDLNFGFTRYRLPPGATLHVTGADGYHEGPYDHRDNETHGQLWTPVVPGDAAVIELLVPAEPEFEPKLELYHVGYGYRDLFDLFPSPKQGACNNDVICPEGDPWRDQIQSVAVYGIGGSTFCTGQMISNLQACGQHQYFLTAEHCGMTAGNAPTMTVYWNFEAPTCGLLSGGSLAQNQTGATFLADAVAPDVTLLELDDVPDPAYNVYYSGWDRSDAIPVGTVAIHHPSTDEKAISFDEDPLTYSAAWSGADTHWRVGNWEDGTTEPGSSGSGIWHPDNGLLIGTLSGGSASCASITNDFYGRFAASWAFAGLDAWLDPDGDGSLTAAGCYSGTNVSLSSWQTLDDDCALGGAGDDNGVWEPGETIQLAIEIEATGPATGVQGTLTTTTPGVTIVDGMATWPDLATGVPALSNGPHFTIELADTMACLAAIDLELVVTADADGPWTLNVASFAGAPLTPAGVPVATVNLGTVTSTIDVAQSVTLSDADAWVQLDHARVGDVILRLESPAGTMVTLLDRPGVPATVRGCNNDDMEITFDDASGFDPEGHCAGTNPWYVGTAAPTEALAAFNGEDSAGTWILHVDDARNNNNGTLLDWTLVLQPAVGCTPCAAVTVETNCGDGIDDDLDGATDCADSDCAAAPECNPEPDCGNGVDDDLDGATDCADSDCADCGAGVQPRVRLRQRRRR